MRSRSPLLLSREPENQPRPGANCMVRCASSRFVAFPFCELGPASTDEVLGIIGRHLDGAIWSDVEVPAGEGLNGSDAGRRLEADVALLRGLQFFGHSPPVLEYSPMRHWRFEPVEELSRRIAEILGAGECSTLEELIQTASQRTSAPPWVIRVNIMRLSKYGIIGCWGFHNNPYSDTLAESQLER